MSTMLASTAPTPGTSRASTGRPVDLEVALDGRLAVLERHLGDEDRVCVRVVHPHRSDVTVRRHEPFLEGEDPDGGRDVAAVDVVADVGLGDRDLRERVVEV